MHQNQENARIVILILFLQSRRHIFDPWPSWRQENSVRVDWLRLNLPRGLLIHKVILPQVRRIKRQIRDFHSAIPPSRRYALRYTFFLELVSNLAPSTSYLNNSLSIPVLVGQILKVVSKGRPFSLRRIISRPIRTLGSSSREPSSFKYMASTCL